MNSKTFTSFLTILYIFVVTAISFYVSYKWLNNNYERIISHSQKILNLIIKMPHFDVPFQSSNQNKTFVNPKNVKTVDIKTDTFIFDTVLYYALWDEIIEKYNLADQDSLIIDSLVKQELKKRSENRPTQYQIKNEIVLTDRLLQVIYLFPRRNETLTYSQNYSDSIFYNIMENTLYTLEFWESPLQFRGYKLNDKKITIYGLQPQNAQIYIMPERYLVLSVDTFLLPLYEKESFTMLK